MAAKKIALFIDADNISAKFGKQIINTLESRGEIFIRRIYGNWEKATLHGWNECILNFSLRAVQQLDFVTGKNATDMSLTIDAMDVLYGGKAEIFALVSNDSDFTPLVIRLREGGMKIIGMGSAHASNSFRFACDEFIVLDAPAEIEIPVESKKKIPSHEKISPDQMSLFEEEKILPAPAAASTKIISISNNNMQSERNKKLQQIHNVLYETSSAHGDEKGFVNLSWAGDAIGKNNLSIKGSGYGSLSKFISAFPNFYEVKDKSGSIYYRCLNAEPKKTSANDTLQQIHNVLCVAATYKDLNDSGGFTDLTRAGQIAHDKKVILKDAGYSSWSKFVSDFPKLYEMRKVGTIIYY